MVHMGAALPLLALMLHPEEDSMAEVIWCPHLNKYGENLSPA